MSKPIAYMMIGEPGSGKSTWIGSLPDSFDAVLLSTDAFIEERAKLLGKTYGEVFHTYIKAATNSFEQDFKDCVSKRSNIILDQTNLSKKKRASILSKLKSYKVIAVVFDIHPDELKRRREKRKNEIGKEVPDHVLVSMANSYEPPDISEGFSEIITVEA